MLRRLGLVSLTCALALAMAGECFAQVKVRTEAIKPSPQSPAQPSTPGSQTGTTAPDSDAAAKKRGGAATVTGPPPEIVLDVSRLPEEPYFDRDLSEFTGRPQGAGTSPTSIRALLST